MDLPLFIFFCFVFALSLGGVLGVYLFRRKPKRQNDPPGEEPDEEVPLEELTGLDLEAALLREMVRRCAGPEEESDRVSLFRARLGSLPKDAPRSAIMKSWRELEEASLRTLSLYDYGDYPVKRLRSIEMMELLKDNGVFDAEHFEICQRLETVRNGIFTLTNLKVSKTVATDVVNAVELLISRLNEFRRSVEEAQATPG